MLYIAEVPLHFGFALVICITTLLLALYGLTDVARRGKDATVSRFSGFLSILFVSLTFMLLLLSMYQLPAAATVTQLQPYYVAAWSCVGLHAFFMVYYLLGTAYFEKRVWAVFLPVLGTLSYLVLLWFLAIPANLGVVSDGVLNYVAMPLTLLVYAGILVILYMVLVPFFVAYRLAKRRKGAEKRWTWVVWFGYLLWTIATVLFGFVAYTATLVFYAFVLGVLAWILQAASFYLLDRASRPKPKR